VAPPILIKKYGNSVFSSTDGTSACKDTSDGWSQQRKTPGVLFHHSLVICMCLAVQEYFNNITFVAPNFLVMELWDCYLVILII